MKKFSLMAAVIVISFILQTSFFSFFNILGTIPDLSLILVVIFAMMTDRVTGGILGIITGILYDAMIYDVFGVYTLIYFIIGSIAGAYSDDMLRENYAVYAVSTAVATLLCHFLLYVLLFFLKYRVGNVTDIFGGIILEVVLNAILSILVLKFITVIFDKLNIK
jgi:rod shape-determining protein MreD